MHDSIAKAISSFLANVIFLPFEYPYANCWRNFKWQNVFQIIWQKLFNLQMDVFWHFDFCQEESPHPGSVWVKASIETILEALMLIKSIISSKAYFYVMKSTQNQQVGKAFEKSLASRSCLKNTSLVIEPLTCNY